MSSEFGLFVGERVDPVMKKFHYIYSKVLENSLNKTTIPGIYRTLDAHRSRYNFSAKLIESTQQKSLVLDLACGTGYGSTSFTDVDWVGIDISQNALNFGRKNNQNPKLRSQLFINADVLRLPFPDGIFDAVVCLETLEHLDLLQVNYFLDLILKKSKKSGLVIISIPNRDWFNPGKEITDAPRNKYHKFEPNFKEFQDMLLDKWDNISFYYQSGCFKKYESIPLVRPLSKVVNIALRRYACIKPYENFDAVKEVPSVFIAVCKNPV